MLAASLSTVCAAPDSFQSFLARLRADAQRAGISSATLDPGAGRTCSPISKVLERYNHQPEFTLTWVQYRTRLITDQRIANGRVAYQQYCSLFGQRAGPLRGRARRHRRHRGPRNPASAPAWATFMWLMPWPPSPGRAAAPAFFRSELMAALHILDHGDVAPTHMMGSYAGAMGQPQFMPSSYLRYAVDFEGNGRRDIWTSKPDVLASIANYLPVVRVAWWRALGPARRPAARFRR